MARTPPPPPQDSPAPAEDLFCMVCGYNQRGIISDRCPECGQLYSQTPPSPVRLPWSHRRHLGHLPAYWRTAAMVLFRKRQFCEEIDHPVSYSDARRFWGLTLLQAYLPFPAAILLISQMSSLPGPKPRGLQDLLFTPLYTPIWPCISLLIGILAFLAAATGVPGYFCHPRRIPITRQNRAIALSYYASAPLALMPLLFMLVAMSSMTAKVPFLSTALALIAAATGLLMFGFWYYHTLGIVAIVAQRGRTWRTIFAFLLPIIWLMLALLFLVIFPAYLHLNFMLIYTLIW